MHGIFAICFTLLTIIAGMLLLAKTQKEALGLFFRIVSYIVITIGFLCLMCCLTRCICRMCGRHDGMAREHCMMNAEHPAMMHGNCGMMMPNACCDKMMGKECKEGKDDDKAKGAPQGAEEQHPVPPLPQKK